MDDIKTVAELVPILHKLPHEPLTWAVAIGSMGFASMKIFKFIFDRFQTHSDRSAQIADERYEFLQQKIEPKLDRILEETRHIKDIKNDLDKIGDRVLTVKCIKK